MKKRIYIILAVLAAATAILLSFLSGKGVTITGHPSTTGVTLFSTYCSPCHGQLGKGDGQLAYMLYPKPRDFTKGVFKIRSTPSGQVPTDEDLAKTVRNGLPGTAMPSFYFLNDQQIQLLVQQIKQLSQECREGTPCKNHFEGQKPQAIQVPQLLPDSADLVTKGKEVYTKLGCVQCHGESGKGDGPSAAGLKDDWGYPIKVRDFTQGTYLGGGDPKDLYLRFTSGLSGTPMPAYGDTIGYLAKNEQEKNEFTWGVVYYVKSLEVKTTGTPQLAPPANGIISVARIDNAKNEQDLLNLQDPDWERSIPATVPMSRLWQRDTNNAMPVAVRAIGNEKYLGLLLEWNDASQDSGSYRVQDFQDAAAVMYSLKDVPGFVGMGAKDSPANMWFWRAEWQMRTDKNALPDLNQAYKNKASDSQVSSYPQEIQEETSLSGRDAGNIVSTPKLSSPVEEVNAAGPGTLTSQPLKDQNVLGRGEWNGKTWRVVFVRPLKDNDRNDVQFKQGKTYPVAFAVWNGSERDRNGQKLVSTWYSLKLE